VPGHAKYSSHNHQFNLTAAHLRKFPAKTAFPGLAFLECVAGSRSSTLVIAFCSDTSARTPSLALEKCANACRRFFGHHYFSTTSVLRTYRWQSMQAIVASIHFRAARSN
jgi:hypothetical protein